MIFTITIKDRKIGLILAKNSEIIDSLEFVEEKNLSEKLLVAIEEMLTRNQLLPAEIEQMKLETDLGENFTTFRIAKAIVETFNFAKNQ